MRPGWWRLGAGLGGLGACAIAPYLSGAGIVLALGVPLAELRYGSALAYWQSLELPAYLPYAGRIRVAGLFGLALAPSLWAAWMIHQVRRLRETHALSPPAVDTARVLRRLRAWTRPRQPPLSRCGLRPLTVPAGESLLVVAPGYPIAHEVLRGALRELAGPVLVIDLDGALHAATAGWRTEQGEVHRLAPFGGGRPWNPFAIAWTPERLRRPELEALAEVWYPERRAEERARVSQVRGLFLALVETVDAVLRAAHEAVPPAPGDLWRALAPLDDADGMRRWLHALTVLPALRPATGSVLRAAADNDDDALRRLLDRLREPLAVFASASVDAATRGPAFLPAAPERATLYLDVPYGHREATVPLIEACVAQWMAWVHHHAPTVVIHGLDLLPPLPCLREHADTLRCIASVRSATALFGTDGEALAARFGVLAYHAPVDRLRAEREARGIAQFLEAHRRQGRRMPSDPSVEDALALRAGEQWLLGPALPRPVRCPVVTPRRHAPHPPHETPGEAMPFPKPLAVLLTSLMTSCVAPEPRPAVTGTGLTIVGKPVPRGMDGGYLGPHAFLFPEEVLKAHYRPSSSPSEISFVLRWPSLEPWPKDVDMYRDQETFVSSLRISVTYLDRLTDEEVHRYLRSIIEPTNPDGDFGRDNPAENLHLRIEGEPVYGLTPYYTDFPALERYYQRLYGPDTRAAEPSGYRNEDWYIDMGPDGIPRTVLKCSPAAIPDGVTATPDGLSVIRGVFERATCDHHFMLPEYRADVHLAYQRIVMADWRRIEDRIRRLFRDGEVKP
jgi:hypothetical protein